MDSQDKNGLSMTKQQFLSEDEETEVSIRKQSIRDHTSRLTRIFHFLVYRR